MRKEVKEKYIEALLYGRYTKGRFCLRIDDEFCPLGVLVDIYIKDHLGIQWEVLVGEELADKTIYHLDYTTDSLPSCVEEWAGLKGEEFRFPFDDELIQSLVTSEAIENELLIDSDGYVYIGNLNDVTDLNFENVATLIGRYF